MSIQRLEISGYRSLEHVVWEPGPLNVLIGPNGSGKSNLLRALALLRAAAEGKLAETVRQEGGMVPLLWDRRAYDLRFNLLVLPFPSAPDSGSIALILEYDLALEQMGKGGAFQVGKERLVSSVLAGNAMPFTSQTFAERLATGATVLNQKSEMVEIPPQHLNGEETLLVQLADPTNYAVQAVFRRLLAAFHIYHDIRVDFASELRRATVARLERQVDPDGSNLIAVLHTLYSSELGFREDVNAAMRAAFGEDFEELLFPPAEDGRVQMRIRWKSLKRPQSTADLSDGTLRFLFLITVLANPTPPSLIAIDEPETGLHPSMLPLVAELAAEASKRTQVILTTHSPQFLNAFSEYPDITTVAEWREGRTVLRRLPADKLAKWLEHYQLGELMMSGELETM